MRGRRSFDLDDADEPEVPSGPQGWAIRKAGTMWHIDRSCVGRTSARCGVAGHPDGPHEGACAHPLVWTDEDEDRWVIDDAEIEQIAQRHGTGKI